MAQKASDAFRTISEAAEELDLPQHVLRHWEETFGAIRPMRRAGGRRYYRVQDLELICGVKALLHGERYTTKGVQKIFKDQGAGFVSDIGRHVRSGMTPEDAVSAVNQPPGSSTDEVTISTEQLRSILTQLHDVRAEVVRLRSE
ncbi:MerR family transcriptional regulator [Parvularcula sp. LCG005]|uniref:MerR family transcriptional regulator n=1 Tax=Parvularcula sp. LCG005 TaxID=3078805 RepID=UPI0029432621|nr:MerR family transcriptional regulator [Parvularcula sp. LCG005]WOI54089.1 MerR family transcriptional regulator [Parvularcula sp. LCG005]